MPEYLTTEELAELLRTTPDTVRYWQHVGKAPTSLKVGRRRLYEREAVSAWIAAQQTAGPEAA